MNLPNQISHEIMVFMRKNYRLDEIGDGKDELKFKQGKKTVLTIYSHEDRYTFLIIFGKSEREKFEAARDTFSPFILTVYDSARTYHDGKWMFIDVTVPEQLEEIKRLILIKKRPNRKPFPQAGSVYGECGHRCDLCIHYAHMPEETRAAIEPHLNRVWGENDWSMRCGGCRSDTCYCLDDLCDQKKCAAGKGLSACSQCPSYPCPQATVGDERSNIHVQSYSADDITWGVLPYVPFQYEK